MGTVGEDENRTPWAWLRATRVGTWRSGMFSTVSCRTYGILKSKQDQVNLTDGRAVKVQVHLELGYCGCHHPVLRGADEVPQDTNYLLDVAE